MARWVVGSILHGGPIELFLVPASVPLPWYVLFCLWDDAYKRTLAANRIEMFYLTTHSTHHFYLRLYAVGHMVKDHSGSERGNPLPPHGLLFPVSSKGSLMVRWIG